MLLFYILLLVNVCWSLSNTVPLVSNRDLGLNYINLQDKIQLSCAPISILLVQPHVFLAHLFLKTYKMTLVHTISSSDLYTVPYISNAASREDWMTFFKTGLKDCYKQELNYIDWTDLNLPSDVKSPILIYKEIESDESFYKIQSLYPQIPIYYSSILDTPMKFKRAPPTSGNQTSIPYSKRSLFQKYVFFNKAIFMGLLPMLLILFIALAGVRILMGIQSPTKFETKFKQL